LNPAFLRSKENFKEISFKQDTYIMGSSQSISIEQENRPTMSSVLSTETVDWDLVCQILQDQPEQACLYAHGVEPSQLWVALTRSAPVEVVRLLVQAYEDALDQPSPTGETLLHLARNDEQTIDFLLQLRPTLAQVTDRKGRLPLHGCSNAAAAKRLIQAYPQGRYQRSHEFGSLPLHYAFKQEETSLDAQLLQVLVEQRRSILSRNQRGQSPLQLLAQRLEQDRDEELWKVLLEWVRMLEPKAPELHTLIEYGCCTSERLMDRALQDFSLQAYERDTQGRTPLHIAALGGCSSEALNSLLRANPKGPRMTDNEGRLPIDWAAESPHIPLQGLALLMKGEPRAIDTRDLRDGHYPFVSAALGDQASVNNTYFLLRAKPHVLSYFHLP
jgi:ankyrin repeat protein